MPRGAGGDGVDRLMATEWASVVAQGWVSLLVLDLQCGILVANQAAHHAAGVAPGQLVGRRFCETLAWGPCGGAGAQACPFEYARQGRERREQPRWLPVRIQGANTTALVGARLVAMPAQDTEQAGTSVIVVTMIPSSVVGDADRKRREMIAAAIHDMRHPLTVLGVTVEMITSGTTAGTPEALNGMLQRLQRVTAQLITDVDDLQNRLLFDAGVVKIEPRQVDAAPLLRQLAWQLEPLLQRRKQAISLALPESLMLWADPSALNQVLGNLLINAHKYSVNDDTIEVSARRLPRQGQIEIRVRDHGPGVPVAERGRIFERFHRGRETTGIHGAGLGLAIVKSFIESHGGEVGVGAPRGGGALFWVRLPAQGPDY